MVAHASLYPTYWYLDLFQPFQFLFVKATNPHRAYIVPQSKKLTT